LSFTSMHGSAMTYVIGWTPLVACLAILLAPEADRTRS
jgi:hypothetical protein